MAVLTGKTDVNSENLFNKTHQASETVLLKYHTNIRRAVIKTTYNRFNYGSPNVIPTNNQNTIRISSGKYPLRILHSCGYRLLARLPIFLTKPKGTLE